MTNKVFWNRFYSPFDGEEDPFACLAKMVGEKAAVGVPKDGQSKRLRSEYLSATLESNCFYSVDQPGSADAVGASVAAPSVREYFQCLSVSTPQSRQKKVPTIRDRSAVSNWRVKNFDVIRKAWIRSFLRDFVTRAVIQTRY